MSARRSLRIGIDAHMLGKHKTGNERWVRNVIAEMRAAPDHDLVAFVAEAEVDLPDGIERRALRPTNPAARQLWSLRKAVREARVDVLLVQYVAPARLPCPVVTVVHDVSFLEHPEWFSPLERLWMPRLIPKTMRQASAVITVSAFSKSEIVRLTGTAPSKVAVAHDGVDPVFRTPAPSPEAAPYFLAVGNVTPRKDLPVAISSYGRARTSRSDFPALLIAGQDSYGASETHRTAARVGPSVRFLGYVDDGTLAGLMQHAVAVLYPSRYEGFGLPVVEAMAAGAPVIASDIPVMREVAGDAAALVPLDDAEAWVDALRRLADDAGHRGQRIAAGKERAAAFTWGRCAREVLGTIERAARPAS